MPKLEFTSGKVSIFGTHTSNYEAGYPKVLIVERRLDSAGDGKWKWRAACVSGDDLSGVSSLA